MYAKHPINNQTTEQRKSRTKVTPAKVVARRKQCNTSRMAARTKEVIIFRFIFAFGHAAYEIERAENRNGI